MNKQLILKAVQAVMDFNELGLKYVAGIELGSWSIWVHIMDTHKNCQYILNTHKATNTDIADFIQKLDELKAV